MILQGFQLNNGQSRAETTTKTLTREKVQKMFYHDTTFFCTFSLISTRSFWFIQLSRLIWSSYYEPLLNTWNANYFRICLKCWSSIGSVSMIWLIAGSALDINIIFKSSLSCNFDVKYVLEQKSQTNCQRHKRHTRQVKGHIRWFSWY